jgi:hypothetical protein
MLKWPIRVLGYLLAVLVYWIIKLGLMPSLRLIGYKRSVTGTCIILAPPKQMRIILQGLTYLRTLDPEMFQRLTTERQYVFWFEKNRYSRCREFFTITDNFLLWGNEGVVTCFVQSVMDSPLEKASPFKKRKLTVITRRQIQQQVFEWLKKHSFSPELTEQYKTWAEHSPERGQS